MVSRQGQTRLSKYHEQVELGKRAALEADLGRDASPGGRKGSGTFAICFRMNVPLLQCSFVEYKDYKLVYRQTGITENENELSIYELVHSFVEVLDKYLNRVSELDIMFNLDKVHIILDEMILNGHIVETNKNRILVPLLALDKMAES